MQRRWPEGQGRTAKGTTGASMSARVILGLRKQRPVGVDLALPKVAYGFDDTNRRSLYTTLSQGAPLWDA